MKSILVHLLVAASAGFLVASCVADAHADDAWVHTISAEGGLERAAVVGIISNEIDSGSNSICDTSAFNAEAVAEAYGELEEDALVEAGRFYTDADGHDLFCDVLEAEAAKYGLLDHSTF